MDQSRWATNPSPDEKKTPTTTAQLHPSSLSGAAPAFSPAPPPPDVSSDDYFAQTGAAHDDIFDEITPVDNSMRVRSEDDLFSDDFTPVAQPVVEQSVPELNRARGIGPRGRGRGRGRVAAPTNGAGSGNHVQPNTAQQNEQTSVQQEAAPSNAPTGPKKEGVPSVRGDRRATGGVRKPKLTEEELAEKMAKIQIKNASLTAAHARAEADAASFAQREEQSKQVSAQRQKEERRDRQQMMGEREKNRMRKMKAMEGREWDAEKNEEDFAKGGRFDKKGGFGGDQQDYTDGREYLYREPRGGGKGGRGNDRARRVTEQAAPKQEDFPSLPAVSQPAMLSPTTMDAVKSWADQVESSNAA